MTEDAAQAATPPEPESARLQDPEDLRAAALAALDTRIPPPRLPALYRLGIVLVAGAMLLLPLVYVALIALAAYGVYWHTVENVGLLTGGGIKLRGLAYFGPVFVGAILVLFMIKPLLARRRIRQVDMELGRDAQPFLFAFVESLCASMRAPKPACIRVDMQVNASAALDGVWRGMLGGRLILTVGLPLVAGLSLRQLAGVLAHEFGHFAQGTGMRATYAINSVNAWFGRVVYERDRWDEQLVAAARYENSLWVMIVAQVARGFVWLTRRILLGLMWIAHAISCFLSRQMEFDADHYQIRLAGTEAMAATWIRVTRLSICSEHAHGALARAWSERRLADDLPAFILRQEHRFAPDVDRKIEAAFSEEKRGLFSTHPRTVDRIAAARRASAPGVLTVDGPASVLLDGFEEVCRAASLRFYEQATSGGVRPEHLVSVGSFAEREAEQAERNESLLRMFQGNAVPLRPLPFRAGPLVGPEDPEAATRGLAELRAAVLDEREAFDRALRAWIQADRAIVEADSANALLAAGIKVDAMSFGIQTPTRASCQQAIGAQEARCEALEPELREFERRALDRLETALGLLPGRAVGSAVESEPTPSEEATRMHEAARTLGGLLRDARDLSRRATVLHYLLRQLEHHSGERKLQSHIGARTASLRSRLQSVREALEGHAYPFPTTGGGRTLEQVILPGVPQAGHAGEILSVAGSVADHIRNLYLRALAELACLAERAEDEAGLERFPRPPEELLQ